MLTNRWRQYLGLRLYQLLRLYVYTSDCITVLQHDVESLKYLTQNALILVESAQHDHLRKLAYLKLSLFKYSYVKLLRY